MRRLNDVEVAPEQPADRHSLSSGNLITRSRRSSEREKILQQSRRGSRRSSHNGPMPLPPGADGILEAAAPAPAAGFSTSVLDPTPAVRPPRGRSRSEEFAAGVLPEVGGGGDPAIGTPLSRYAATNRPREMRRRSNSASYLAQLPAPVDPRSRGSPSNGNGQDPAQMLQLAARRASADRMAAARANGDEMAC